MKTTRYFETSVMLRRPYLRTAWIERVLGDPVRTEAQNNGRVRRWAFIEEERQVLASGHRARWPDRTRCLLWSPLQAVIGASGMILEYHSDTRHALYQAC